MGRGGTVLAPAHQCIHRVGFTFEQCLHRIIPGITHPAPYTPQDGLALTTGPECHALHTARHDYVNPFFTHAFPFSAIG